MTNTDEAAAIFVQTFNALAKLSGKCLSQKQRQAIARACDLLGQDGIALDDVFDDLPRISPAERMAGDAEKDPAYIEWRRERQGRER